MVEEPEIVIEEHLFCVEVGYLSCRKNLPCSRPVGQYPGHVAFETHSAASNREVDTSSSQLPSTECATGSPPSQPLPMRRGQRPTGVAGHSGRHAPGRSSPPSQRRNPRATEEQSVQERLIAAILRAGEQRVVP